MEPHAVRLKPPGFYLNSSKKSADCRRQVCLPIFCHRAPEHSGDTRLAKRRDVLITPLLAAGAYALRSAMARAEVGPETEGETEARQAPKLAAVSSEGTADAPEAVKEEVINSRIYDATVIVEPMALGKDKRKVWEKMMDARIVYLGEAEQVPTRDDKDLEFEIVRNLRKRCVDAERPMSLAMEAFPCNLQEQLDSFLDKRIDGEALKSCVTYWPPQRWQEYEPLLAYCRDNGVRLVACGVPLEDIQTGLDLGIVSPEVLQNFFDLEQYPVISELTRPFQGFRERLLADPKFLNRLATEEAI